ncbi:MAG: hypothetical protein O3C40_15395 [Planctomycetota bacterium]|nr:hypothetical protein [Planctomycetota bacterium]
MIDLSQSPSASPLVHTVATEPGTAWAKDAAVAIEAPPDADADPRPEARWSRPVCPAGLRRELM